MTLSWAKCPNELTGSAGTHILYNSNNDVGRRTMCSQLVYAVSRDTGLRRCVRGERRVIMVGAQRKLAHSSLLLLSMFWLFGYNLLLHIDLELLNLASA